MSIISKIKWLLFNVLAHIPIPLNFYSFIELISSSIQGKGWGSSTVNQEVNACLSLLERRPKNLIDIGAHHGLYTSEVLRRIPEIECHLFEPSSVNIALLKENFLPSRQITINPFALSNRQSNAKLYSNTPGSVISSLTKRRLDHFERLESQGYDWKMDVEENVDVIRFDQYWSEKNNVYIDYMKIDVEGHELEVLEGIGNLIHNIKLIQFEFGGCNIDTRTFFQDFWYFFLENDFLSYRITPRGVKLLKFYTPRDENFMTSNFVAINQRL